jgi:hypothetical protein
VWPGLQARFLWTSLPGLKARPHNDKITPHRRNRRACFQPGLADRIL